MALSTRLFVALSLSVLVTTPATASASASASANSSDWTEAEVKRLPGNGPYLYKDCITPFSGHWVQTLPFRSTYSTAEELMANTPFKQCVKFGWSSYHQFET